MIKRFLNNNFKNKSKWFWGVIFTSFIIDYINSYFYDNTQNYFYKILSGKNLTSVIYIILLMLLFIFMLIITGKMSSDDKRAKAINSGQYKPAKKNTLTKIADIFFGIILIGFSVITIMPLINILGIGEQDSIFTSNLQMWIMISSVVLIIVIAIAGLSTYKPRFILGTSKYFIIYIPIIILTSLFIDFSTAIWHYSFAPTDTVVDPDRSGKVIEFIAFFPLFIIFFSAPRFILLRKSINFLTLISALTMIGYFVWKSLDFIQI